MARYEHEIDLGEIVGGLELCLLAAATPRRARRLRPRRLRDRHRGPHAHLPGGDRRSPHRQGPGHLRRQLQGVSAAQPLHHGTRRRKVLLHPHHHHLAAARAQAKTEEFDAVYRRWRPMIERTLAWLTRGTNRKLRYRGVERNQLWWSHRCAAVNLQRLITLGLIPGNDGGWAIA